MLNKEEFLKKIKIDTDGKKKLCNFLMFLARQKNSCFMCKHKFEKTVLNKENAGQFVPLVNMFSGEFLFHLKETHGIAPFDFFDIVEKYCEIKVIGKEKLIDLE